MFCSEFGHDATLSLCALEIFVESKTKKIGDSAENNDGSLLRNSLLNKIFRTVHRTMNCSGFRHREAENIFDHSGAQITHSAMAEPMYLLAARNPSSRQLPLASKVPFEREAISSRFSTFLPCPLVQQ